MREPIKSYEEWDIFDMKEGCCSELEVRKLEADHAELEEDLRFAQGAIEASGILLDLAEKREATLEKKYQNDPATIQLLECTDKCIDLEKQRDELQEAFECICGYGGCLTGEDAQNMKERAKEALYTSKVDHYKTCLGDNE